MAHYGRYKMKTSTTKSVPSDPLRKLLAMPIAERIAAIARDVRTKRDEFRNVNPHELADALGVDQPESPTNDWTFTRYAEKQNLEEYAECHDAVSELVFLLESDVSDERYQVLLKKFAALVDYSHKRQFGFLAIKERKLLEEKLAEQQLESNDSDGMCCLAHYRIPVRGWRHLVFEACVEDDGSCFDLKTPYDQRDGKFVNLENCVTESW